MAVYTYDFWDTIVRRTCHHDESKLFVCKHIYTKYHNQCLKNGIESPLQVLFLRQKIESDLFNALYNKTDGEFTLEQVISNLLNELSINEQSIQDLVEMESNFEKSVIYLDPHIQKFINTDNANQRYVLSDFYMGKEFVEFVLKQYKLHSYFDDIFVSCEIGCSKRSGKSYAWLKGKLNIKDMGAVCHVGDNLSSDYENAINNGLKAHWYTVDSEIKKKESLMELYETRMSGQYGKKVLDYIAEKLDKKSCIEKFNHELNEYQKSLFNIGLNISLVFYIYVLNIIELSNRDGVAALAFFTREGELFKKIYDLSVEDNTHMGFTHIPSVLLEVSRLSTFFASLLNVELSEFKNMWSLYSNQTMKVFFSSLGLNIDEYKSYLDSSGLMNVEESIDKPWQDKRVESLFRNTLFINKLKHDHQIKRKLLTEYLQRKIEIVLPSIGFVDIGWRGSIQDNLARIMPNTQTYGYYLALNIFFNPQTINVKKYGFYFNANVDSNNGIWLLNNVSIIEAICNSSRGSIVGYVYDGNANIVAVEDDGQKTEKLFHYRHLRHIQDGIVEGCRTLSKLSHIHTWDSSEFKNICSEILKSIIIDPPEALVKMYSQLQHNEKFGAGFTTSESKGIPFKKLAMAVLHSNFNQIFEKYMVDTGWSNWRCGFYSKYKLNFFRKIKKKFKEVIGV